MTDVAAFDALRERWIAAGQAHVFAFWPMLSDAERTQLATQCAAVDLEELARIQPLP